jgi:glycosyltransferase involved in cell wall biosynthesis
LLKNILKASLIGGFGILGSSKIIELRMKEYNTDILQPIDKVSIILPSFDEVQYIDIALSSILNQSIITNFPDYFELIVADSCSTDGTIELAQKILQSSPIKNSILITPRGKLTARNQASNQAKGNIIVSIDADTYYPVHYLNTLLEPFNNISNAKYENVVAVSGSTFDYSIDYIPGSLFSLGDFLYNKLINVHRIVGRNSCYLKHVHYLAGGFDETIDQSQIFSIFKEEEIRFGERLSKFGKIIYKISASCFHLGGSKSLNRIIKKDDYKRNTF